MGVPRGTLWSFRSMAWRCPFNGNQVKGCDCGYGVYDGWVWVSFTERDGRVAGRLVPRVLRGVAQLRVAGGDDSSIRALLMRSFACWPYTADC